MAAGEVAAGDVAAGEVAAGEVAAGVVAAGEVAAGVVAAGEVAAGVVPERPGASPDCPGGEGGRWSGRAADAASDVMPIAIADVTVSAVKALCHRP